MIMIWQQLRAEFVRVDVLFFQQSKEATQDVPALVLKLLHLRRTKYQTVGEILQKFALPLFSSSTTMSKR